MHIGGRPSPTEKVYNALRTALGTTVDGREVAGPKGGIEDQWRIARARVIARTIQLDELAALQAIPGKATVHLPIYERLFGVTERDNDVQRQAAVAAVVTAQLSGVVRKIAARLLEIDSGIAVFLQSDDLATTAHFGWTYADRSGTPIPYGNREAADMPNLSSHYVLIVRWSGAPGGIPPTDKRREIERYLNDALPSWCTYTIQNGAGFYCDGYNNSLLDLTALGS
jgi:hypothetical protein